MSEKFQYQLIHKRGCGKPALLLQDIVASGEAMLSIGAQHLNGQSIAPRGAPKCDTCGAELDLRDFRSEYVEGRMSLKKAIDADFHPIIGKMDAAMDELLVECIAEEMRARLKQKREEGRGGWWNGALLPMEELRVMAYCSLNKIDKSGFKEIDSINLIAMLFMRKRIGG